MAMYKLRPVFELDNFNVVTPMYSLRNIQEPNLGEMRKNPLLDEVEARQHVILQQIQDIKLLIDILKKRLSEPKITPKRQVTSSHSTQPQLKMVSTHIYFLY